MFPDVAIVSDSSSLSSDEKGVAQQRGMTECGTVRLAQGREQEWGNDGGSDEASSRHDCGPSSFCTRDRKRRYLYFVERSKKRERMVVAKPNWIASVLNAWLMAAPRAGDR